MGGNHQFSSASVAADENMFPGYFRRPSPRPTKIAWHLFSSAITGPTKIVSRPLIFVGLGKADENTPPRLFSSARWGRRKYMPDIFIGPLMADENMFPGYFRRPLKADETILAYFRRPLPADENKWATHYFRRFCESRRR